MGSLLKHTTFPKCTIALQNDKFCVRVLLILLKTCIEIFKTLKSFNTSHYFIMDPKYISSDRDRTWDRSKMVTTKDGNLHTVKVSRDPNYRACL